MNQASRLVGWLLPLLLGVGCRSVERFDTRPGAAYCGSLVGQGVISTGFEESGWEGSAGQQTLSLTLNTAEMFRSGGVPAVVTSHDAAFGPCGPDQPLFQRAEARTLGAALGDRLSAMRLNEDHEEDIVTFVDSTCSGSMVAILSLIKNGDVEVRLLRPAPANSGADIATPDATGRFGLFELKKIEKGCGF